MNNVIESPSGEKILMDNKLQVPNEPIIPLLR